MVKRGLERMLGRWSGRPAISAISAAAAPQDGTDDDESYITATFAGRTFKLDPANGADQVARDIVAGSYEAPLPMLMMASLVRVEGAFVDVGANTGVYSVMAALIAPGRPILAFEPLPLALAAFRRNIAANGIQHAITVDESALSDRSGKATLHIPDPGHGLIETSASLEDDFKPRSLATTVLEVSVATLDSLDLPGPIGVIKVDIEGHEHAFLEGARATIARDRPIVFIELLQGAPSHRIRRFVRELDYLDFRLRPDLAIHDGGEILYDPLAWNHALVPAERLPKFQEACQSCGLAMLRRFVPA